MYDVLVLNTNFETVGIIDYYISLIWTERYAECGDFELTLKSDSSVFKFIGVGYYLWIRDAKMTMIIEKIEVQTDVEDGNGLILSGRSLESLLDRRIIWPQTNLSGKLQNGIKQLITSCFINPTWDTASRRVSNFRFIDSTDARITSLDLKAQYTGDSLYDTISAICMAYDIGFFVRLNDEENTFEFGLYKGEDRSFDQESLSYVVFSSKYDNLAGSNYLESDEKLKTLTIVGGEGEGIDRKTVTVISSSGTGYGLGRRELFTDAKDISQNKNSDTPMSDAAYEAALNQRGLEKLADCVGVLSFEGEVEDGQTFSYDRDYFMGDVVQLRDEYEREGTVRVTELIRSIDTSGFEVYPTFVATYKATIILTGNVGDKIIVSGTGYGYEITIADSNPIEIVVTKTGSYVFYGWITGITRNIEANTYSLEYAADLRFNANLNIITNVGAVVHLLSEFDKTIEVYKSRYDQTHERDFPEEGSESKAYLTKDTFDIYEWKKIAGSNPEQFEYRLVTKTAASGYSYYDWGDDFISLYYTSTANSNGLATKTIYREGLYNLLSSLGPYDDEDKTIALSTVPESKATINPDAIGQTFNGVYVYVWVLNNVNTENVKEKKILKYSSRSAFPATGEISKWYYDKTADIYYSWNGTTYVQVSDIDKPNGDGDYQTRDVQIYFDDPLDQVTYAEQDSDYYGKDYTKYYTGTALYVSRFDYPTEPDSTKFTLIGDGYGTKTRISPDIGYKLAFEYKNLTINQDYKFSAWPYIVINGTRYYGSRSTASIKITITAVGITIKQQPEGGMTCLVYWDKPKTLYTGVEIYYSDDVYPDRRDASKYTKLYEGKGNLIDINEVGDDDSMDYYDGWITVDDDSKESSKQDHDYKYTYNWTIPDKEKTYYFSTWTYYEVDGTRYYCDQPNKQSFEWQPKQDSGSGSGSGGGSGSYDGWITVDDDDDNG